jgi:hypothetical protein
MLDPGQRRFEAFGPKFGATPRGILAPRVADDGYGRAPGLRNGMLDDVALAIWRGSAIFAAKRERQRFPPSIV